MSRPATVRTLGGRLVGDGQRYVPPPAELAPEGALNMSALGRELGCRYDQAQRRLRAAGIVPRRIGTRLIVTPSQVRELREFEDGLLDAQIGHDDLLNVSEAARLIGHSSGTNLGRLLDRHGIPALRLGRHRMVRLADLERYEQQVTPQGAERRSERPRGWLGVDAAAELAGVHTSTLRLWVRRGEVEAVIVGKALFYNPASLRAAAERRRQVQPADWEALIEVHPRDVSVVRNWLEERGFPVRPYLKADGSGRVRNCTTRAGAAAWRQRPGVRRTA